MATDWETIHSYYRAATTGVVPVLECEDCAGELTRMLGEDDEVILHCFICNSGFRPGINFFDKINNRLENEC